MEHHCFTRASRSSDEGNSSVISEDAGPVGDDRFSGVGDNDLAEVLSEEESEGGREKQPSTRD